MRDRRWFREDVLGEGNFIITESAKHIHHPHNGEKCSQPSSGVLPYPPKWENFIHHVGITIFTRDASKNRMKAVFYAFILF